MWLGCILTFSSACLISIIRAVQVRDTSYKADPTWDGVFVKYWTIVELNISVIVPCLLVLKPLLAKLFPSLSRPQPSPSPEDAPQTIGSDPFNRRPASERTHSTRESWGNAPSRGPGSISRGGETGKQHVVE